MFSTTYKSSKQPTKQRVYKQKAPAHIRGKFMHVHLADELQKKHNTRALRLRVGDKVKVVKGQFKGKSGKVNKIIMSSLKIHVEGVDAQKKDGTKQPYPLTPGHIMITELNTTDKKRPLGRTK